MSATVRRAAPGDVPDILRLIRALAAYEREPDAVEATVEMLTATLFADGAIVHAHVAEREGAIVGIAVWFLNYSTWTGKPGLYLEDLFVEAAARGGGVGRALLVALAREAVARGCARMDWAVLDWNEDAMAAYRAVGAKPAAGWQPWRLEGKALARLAA
ncbi:N-acetyltransferase family protein [Sphingomonas sp.]|uniref:GNAT family N-acetyltransferase n=1 Tax=Sphingomonas sp. TaxID=28214 RepID=UPI003B00590C